MMMSNGWLLINIVNVFFLHNLFQDVSGQVVLITGGGGGVGRILALNFAKLRTRVVIWDINKDGEYSVLSSSDFFPNVEK